MTQPVVIETTFTPTVVDVDAPVTGDTVQVAVSNVPGPVGPTNTLTIGTVSTLPAGGTATASITGTAPTQTLNLGIPKGDPGTVQDLASPNGTVTVAGTAGHPTVDVVYGTAAHTAAQGNDTRIVNALQPTTAAGGDSSGTLGNLSNNKIKGVSVTNTPTAGSALVATSTTAAAWGPLSAVSGRWGDGSDGTVVISTNTSLTRDMYYNNLTINSGVALNTNGWRVHVANTLTVNSTGVLGAPGAVGTGTVGVAGVAGAVNTLGSGKAGGTGTTGVGGAGAATTLALAGGAGGAGGTAAGTAGAGGTSTALLAATFNNPRTPFTAFDFIFLNATAFAFPNGGAGGGAGGGDGANPGGGGGAGGGIALINARIIVNNGSINADGGAGRPGTVGNAAGGGGGGGGTVFVNTTAITGSGTVTANGGAGGVKSGTGNNGSAGSAGYAQLIVWTV